MWISKTTNLFYHLSKVGRADRYYLFGPSKTPACKAKTLALHSSSRKVARVVKSPVRTGSLTNHAARSFERPQRQYLSALLLLKMIKQIVLLVVTSLAALAFWLVAKPLIEGPLNFQQVETWLWPLVFLGILGGLLALSFLLLEQWTAWLVTALNLVIFALLFNPREIIIWGGVVIAFFFQLSARKTIQRERNNRLHLDLKLTIDHGLR